MAYTVKEIFLTLQGEGAQTGRAAVFCRFTGCNLWSGREIDRDTATCRFCDTDFIGTNGEGGGKFRDAATLTQAITQCWTAEADHSGRRYVVFTGGEPLLQIDPALITTMHDAGFEIAVETNGTITAPEGIDWVCVSPKADAPLAQTSGSELKLVFPQDELTPEMFETLDFKHFWLQPMDGPNRIANTQAAVAYCRAHPRWRLSLQTHKMIDIP
ncbi:7-carboxy-7-deazaguanine synthase [Neokomagataea anthophila]|uniref:7-carboxy-7-deazaguanine synthase n=1 Tax=Neokomagataea anthophila TaxID=2826925 RepID=A0ABS5E3G8_9PROT|nr:7-carboxy-7-deazaguanine synthase [Neokomagataea anthophila]MBR0558450.1 7-carboxy-7-deazaguanine synthase [Neokomagataea anthophila]